MDIKTYALTKSMIKSITKGDPAVIDQTYTPDSENAQSGKAVAEALARIGGADTWEKVAEIELEEPILQFDVSLNNTYSSFIVFYYNPKNTTDTGANYGLWLTILRNNISVKSMNWFKAAVRTNMDASGYVKFNKINNYLVEIEDADYGTNNSSMEGYQTYNGNFYKNLISINGDISFDTIRIREYGEIRFEAGSKFIIFAR